MENNMKLSKNFTSDERACVWCKIFLLCAEHELKEKQRHKKYYWENREKRLKDNAQWYKDNLVRMREKKKEYCKNNPEKVEKWGRTRRDKLKNDLKYVLRQRVACGIRKSLNRNKQGYCWEGLVGYTTNDLIKHLKETIPLGYEWGDIFKGKLHIDHIIPVSVFNFTSPEHVDFKRCWALNNLRLLPARENIVKHTKLERPFQPCLKF